MIHLMLEIVGVWLIAILMGMPLFASMGLAALAFVIFSGLSPSIVPQKMAQAMNSFPLVAAPLFILMGNLLGAAKLTDRIVRFATSLVGSLRGGYAHASILSSMIFAGMVGSAVADAAGTGAVEVRAMKKAGYRAETAAAISAAAATIGPIIPPSLPMVIYGVSADVSIGRLFLAVKLEPLRHLLVARAIFDLGLEIRTFYALKTKQHVIERTIKVIFADIAGH